jgi:RNA-directed DNA polymerase
VPIGNYLSQYFANFYLTGFDHWLKETKKVKYYFRYCDDLVILSNNKEALHDLREEIEQYLMNNLRLTIKSNYQVFPVAIRGIDFVGYKHFHSHTLLRKSIKKRFVKMVTRRPSYHSMASYYGWIKHCNGANLYKKYFQ